MRRTLAITLILSASLLAACGSKQEKIASDLEKHGTMDLMKDVANDKYEAPKDGRLTDAQVQMYLKVREHEKQIAQVAKQQIQQHADQAKKDGDKSIAGMMEGFKAMGSIADFATADIRAAKDLHYNTQEYLWVKTQILAASTSAFAEKAAQAMSAQMDASYAQIKKSYDEAKDDQTKKMYADMLAGFEKSKSEAAAQKQQEDPAVGYNRQLLSKYENALNAFTNEMAKFEDKAGDAQKSAEQFQKDVENAKKTAEQQQ